MLFASSMKRFINQVDLTIIITFQCLSQTELEGRVFSPPSEIPLPIAPDDTGSFEESPL